MPTTAPIGEIIQGMVTNSGRSLLELSFEHPVMLVFLRHFGCVFCREALSDIAQKRDSIEEKGARIVFVHMAENDIAHEYLKKFGLEVVPHISDPECRFYSAFGLTKGTFSQLFGLQVWMRGFSAGMLTSYAAGSHLGDSFQMPGVFVIMDGKVREQYIHKMVSDRPDYEELASCCAL